jgi:hypothetical protein
MGRPSNDFLPQKLDLIQEEVLIGSLLGDGSLEFAKSSRFPRLKIDRQILDKEYLLWQQNIFKDLCMPNSVREVERFDKRYNKYHQYIYFRTRAIPAFKSYHEKFYVGGKKIVPNDLILSPLIVAVWFADDGCLIKTGKNAYVLKIATDGFGEIGTKILSEKLENILECSFPIYQKEKGKDLYFIKTSTKSALTFIEYIKSEFNFGMERKLCL